MKTRIENRRFIVKEYKLKQGKIGKRIVDTYKNIEKGFINTFLQEDKESSFGYSIKNGRVANNVIAVYKKNEESVVNTHKKIEDKFVNAFLEEVKKDNKN